MNLQMTGSLKVIREKDFTKHSMGFDSVRSYIIMIPESINKRHISSIAWLLKSNLWGCQKISAGNGLSRLSRSNFVGPEGFELCRVDCNWHFREQWPTRRIWPVCIEAYHPCLYVAIVHRWIRPCLPLISIHPSIM